MFGHAFTSILAKRADQKLNYQMWNWGGVAVFVDVLKKLFDTKISSDKTPIKNNNRITIPMTVSFTHLSDGSNLSLFYKTSFNSYYLVKKYRN